MEYRNELIIEYFHRNYMYSEIQDILYINHGYRISITQLKRVLSNLGLYRRKNYSPIEEIIDVIDKELSGAGQQLGYRFMHQKCKKAGLVVPRSIVMEAQRLMDPVGVELRKKKRLIRRRYYAKGPNWCWHIDSYDKLKPYGICINGCVDGFSRKVIWVEAFVTNSDPKFICGYYMAAVSKANGCPHMIRIDKGTENVHVTTVQKFLHDDQNNGTSVIIGPSLSNVKIESWWGWYRKQNAEFYIALFHGLQNMGEFTGDEADKELIRFCFMKIIQVLF